MHARTHTHTRSNYTQRRTGFPFRTFKLKPFSLVRWITAGFLGCEYQRGGKKKKAEVEEVLRSFTEVKVAILQCRSTLLQVKVLHSNVT